MDGLYVTLGIIAGIAFLYFIILHVVSIVHSTFFRKRFVPNPLIQTYSLDENLYEQTVTINHKKDIITGHFIYGKNYDDSKIVVFSHGIDSYYKSYMQEGNYLANHGFKVFMYDALGTNSTSGNIEGLSNGPKTLDIVIKYLKAKYPDKKIISVGHSWGAFSAINAGAQNNVDKIVAISPFVSINRIIRDVSENVLVKALLGTTEIVEFVKCGKFAFSDSVKSLNRFKGKALVIHSKDDYLISYYKHMKYIMDHVKNKNVNYLVVDHKGHNPSYTEEGVTRLKDSFYQLNELEGKEKDEYLKQCDFISMGKLDEKLMDQIVSFIRG